VVSQISRPFITAAGLDLNFRDVAGLDLDLELIRNMEVLDGTIVEDVLKMSPWNDDGDGDYDPDENTDAYDFDKKLVVYAEEVVSETNDLADKVGLPEDCQNTLRPKGHSRPMHPDKKKEDVRRSVDTIRSLMKRAGRAGDLEKQEIGGLRKTVMQDGRVLWLSQEARSSGWDKVDEERLLEDLADEGDEIMRSPVIVLAKAAEEEPAAQEEVEPEPEPEPEPVVVVLQPSKPTEVPGSSTTTSITVATSVPSDAPEPVEWELQYDLRLTHGWQPPVGSGESGAGRNWERTVEGLMPDKTYVVRARVRTAAGGSWGGWSKKSDWIKTQPEPAAAVDAEADGAVAVPSA
jgi:hypothetical protein